MRVHLRTTIVMLAVSADALAFTEGSFRYGMPEADVLAVLDARQAAVHEVGSQAGVYLATYESRPPESVSFCNGVLTSYEYNVAPTPSAFVRLVEKETLASGGGEYEASTHETPAGEWSLFSVTWRTGGIEKVIAMSQVAEDSPQVSVRYAGQDVCRDEQQPKDGR